MSAKPQVPPAPQRQIDADIESLQRQVLALQRVESVGELTVGVVHSLNNIFARMVLALECIGDREMKIEPFEFELLQKSTDFATNLVRGLGDFVRGADSPVTDVAPKEVLENLTTLFAAILPGEVQLEIKWAPDLPKVHADAIQMQQVLLNLCLNAGAAMENHGIVQVSASLIAPYICFEVSDRGHGMTTAAMAKCFDPFYSTGSNRLGLGLTVCQAIASRLGGYVKMQSELGVGSSAHFYVPAVT